MAIAALSLGINYRLLIFCPMLLPRIALDLLFGMPVPPANLDQIAPVHPGTLNTESGWSSQILVSIALQENITKGSELATSWSSLVIFYFLHLPLSVLISLPHYSIVTC
jgi:hypothetical protein